MNTSDTATSLLEQAARYGIDHLEHLRERRVAPLAEDLDRANALDKALPEGPVPAATTLELLHTLGSPATMASPGGRYFGFVIGGSLPVAAGANWLATAWDQNAGLDVTSPISALIERVAERWVVDLLHLPPGSRVGFVTSVTTANFCGLAAARHALLARQDWDVEAKGLFGAPEITVIIGAEAHGSLKKALSLVGFGRDRVITVPTDEQGRMRADRFPFDAVNDRTIVCLQAGNVNTGSFDPAALIIPEARRRGAWVHVDGAFGLWAGASPDHAHLVHGYADADSWATDGHKWPNLPYDNGMVICRDEQHLRAAMSMTGDYLDQSGPRIPYQYTLELSRRARGVDVWAALHTLGRQGVAELIGRTCAHALRFAAALREAGFEVLNDVVINQVLVSFGSAERTERTIKAVQADGTCWCGRTKWRGAPAMRISVSSWATTSEDVERSIEAIVRCARSSA
jgi:glutamate/tyrosine decarboxylase-like PLP-dependent enzyme